MNGKKHYVLLRSKTEIHTYEGGSLRTAGSNGKCKSSNNEVPEWVQCDNDPKVYC